MENESACAGAYAIGGEFEYCGVLNQAVDVGHCHYGVPEDLIPWEESWCDTMATVLFG